jgi:very-long-chain enoyl-CoA reductase
LYECVAAHARSSIRRLRITKGSDGSLIPNAQTLALHSTGLRDQSSIYVKDLGESDV